MSEKKEYVMNPYDHLKAYDVVKMLKPLLDTNFYLRPEDGKLKARQVGISSETPWIHIRHGVGYDCGLWHQITFNVVVSQLPQDQKFVPRGCHKCWKVVVKPRTLQQLFNLLEVQRILDRPSKCGIEMRPTVGGLYGGYFYNHSVEEGLECYEIVKAQLLNNEHLAPLVSEVDSEGRTTRIILKRGCTEYEHAIGDSSKWSITEGQDFIEDLIDEYIVNEQLSMQQPEHVVWSIKRRWIEFAFEHGDETYKEYTAGKPIAPDYVVYHQPKEVTP